MVTRKEKHLDSSSRVKAKQQYQTPKLQVFGKVAELTQSASGICKSDNGACSAPNNNMGMM